MHPKLRRPVISALAAGAAMAVVMGGAQAASASLAGRCPAASAEARR
jgi:hypothetical protein